MISLVIDTATERGVVGLFSEKGVLFQKELTVGLSNSRSLLPVIEELCSLASLAPADLSYVAVGHGPGSYTGIRVGVSSAKALSLALGIPLIGVGSLRGYVPEMTFSETFFSAIDAKIGGVYLMKGRWQQGQVAFLTEEELVPFDAFIEKLPEAACIVTPNRQALASRLEKQGVLQIPEIIEKAPSVEVLTQEAIRLFESKCYSLDGSLSLLYLRKTQVEI